MPPGPDAKAIGSEMPLEFAEEEEEVYFLPGMRRKSDGNTVGVPLPFVPAGGLGAAGLGTAGFREGGAAVDAMGRSCPGGTAAF